MRGHCRIKGASPNAGPGELASASLRTRALPGWLGWSALVIGVLQFVGTAFASLDPGFTGLPTFAGFLWFAIVSVLLARRGQRS